MSQNSFPLQFKPLSTMNFDFEKEQASALLYNFRNHFYCFLQLFIRLSLFVTSTFFSNSKVTTILCVLWISMDSLKKLVQVEKAFLRKVGSFNLCKVT